MSEDSADVNEEELLAPSKLLSGSALLQIHVSAGKSLPKDGIKEFSPTNSWMEKKQIQCALDERKELLADERVDKWSCLAGAVWNHKKKLAEVTRRAGKHFQTLGFEKDGTLFLYPEEALYLLETNSLELDFGGVSMSIQQAYSLLLGPSTGCELNDYRVYSCLVRQGYRLRRFTKQIVQTEYERAIRLHQVTNVKCNPSQARKNEQNRSGESAVSQTMKVENYEVLNKEPMHEITSLKRDEPQSSSQQRSFNACDISATDSDSNGVQERSETVKSHGEESEMSLIANNKEDLIPRLQPVNDNEDARTSLQPSNDKEDITSSLQPPNDEKDMLSLQPSNDKEDLPHPVKNLDPFGKTTENSSDSSTIERVNNDSCDMACKGNENQEVTSDTEDKSAVDEEAGYNRDVCEQMGYAVVDQRATEDHLSCGETDISETLTHVSNEEVQAEIHIDQNIIERDKDPLGFDKPQASNENSVSETTHDRCEDSKDSDSVMDCSSNDNEKNENNTNLQHFKHQNTDSNNSSVMAYSLNGNNGTEKDEISQNLKRPATFEEDMIQNQPNFKKAKVPENDEDIEILEYVPEKKQVELVDLSDESSTDTPQESTINNDDDSNSIEVIDVGDSSSSMSTECTSSESNDSSVIVEDKTGSNSGFSWDAERRRILEIIPNMHNLPEITLTPPRSDLLPQNVEPQRPLYHISRRRLMEDGKESFINALHNLPVQEGDYRLLNHPYNEPPRLMSQAPSVGYAPHVWGSQPAMPMNVEATVEAVHAITRMVLPMLGIQPNGSPPEQTWAPNNSWFPHRPWGPRRPGPWRSGTRGMMPRFNQHPFRGTNFQRFRTRQRGTRRFARRYPHRGQGAGSNRSWQHSPNIQVQRDQHLSSETLAHQSTSRALVNDSEKTQEPSSWDQVKTNKPLKQKKRKKRYFNSLSQDLLDKNRSEDVMSDSVSGNVNSSNSTESDSDSSEDSLENNSSFDNTDESCSSPQEVRPLLSPRECKDFESVFKSVQVLVEADTQSLVSTTYERRLKPQFDLFSPTKPFRKGNSPIPDFYLCVMRASDEVPAPGEIRILTEALGDSVPVMFAIVSPDSINFFQFGYVNVTGEK